MLSRRDVLAGTAATVSMLSTPALAMPPIFAGERIFHDGAPWPIKDWPEQWSGFHDAKNNQLVGLYYQREYNRSAFDFDTIVGLVHAGRFAHDSNADHRAVFFKLLSDNRDRFIPGDFARRLHARPGAGPLYFRTADGWMMLRISGQFDLKIRRRDRINA